MQSGNPVRLIRHPRARRLRLRFDLTNGEAVLTMPPRASRAQAMAFLTAQQEWLEAQRARLTPPTPFAPGITLDILGHRRTLLHEPAQRGAKWTDDALIIGGAPEHFARRVQSAVKAKALALFTAQATAFSAQLGLDAPKVALRDTRSRWGSCTADGRIQLSWRLAFAPATVARYVVGHEVAHRRELNHSPRFWKIVTNLVGDHTTEREWLTREGYHLLRLGVAELPPKAELKPEPTLLARLFGF